MIANLILNGGYSGVPVPVPVVRMVEYRYIVPVVVIYNIFVHLADSCG